MSKHHLVVFANYVRDTGFTLIEAVRYIGDHYDELAEIDNDLIIANFSVSSAVCKHSECSFLVYVCIIQALAQRVNKFIVKLCKVSYRCKNTTNCKVACSLSQNAV